MTFRTARTVDDAFGLLREAVERTGVYVLLMETLGTTQQTSIRRCFAVSRSLIRSCRSFVINENDVRSAWAFTLLHELAHVFLGETGISGYDGAERIEQVCDEAAARFLLRRDELEQVQVGGHLEKRARQHQ